MGYSLLQIGADTRKQALSGLKSAANNEERRKQAEDGLKAADRAQTMNSIGMGMGLGMAAGGPVGAGVGAAAGFVIGELF